MRRLLFPTLISLAACAGGAEVPDIVDSPVAARSGRSVRSAEAIAPIRSTPVGSVEAGFEPVDIPATEVAVVTPTTPVALDAEPADEASSEASYEVVEVELRQGERMFHLAEWAGIDLETLAAANDVHLGEVVYPGQSFELPISASRYEGFQASRSAFHEARMARYLDRHGGLASISTVSLATGDRAWDIAHDHGAMPLWVLQAYNPDTDLDRIRVGDLLQVPVLGDTLDVTAEADLPVEVEPGPVVIASPDEVVTE